MVSIRSSKEPLQSVPDYLTVSTAVRSLKPYQISVSRILAHYRQTLAAGLLPVLQYVIYIIYDNYSHRSLVKCIAPGALLSAAASSTAGLLIYSFCLSISALVSYTLV